MVLSGLLLPASVTGSLSYALTALGLAGTGLASVTTWSLDRTASARLEAARRQLETARKQREETLAQCGLLDTKIPADATTLERRLAAAQAEVDRLEALAAQEGSVHVLAERSQAAEQALAATREDLKVARGRWRKALELRGLPPTLTPREVRQISAHRHTLLTLDDDRRRLSEEARTKREEVAAFGRRVDELLVECELLPEATPLDHLRLLQERLDADKAVVRRRGLLTRRLEVDRRRHRHALRQVKVAERAVGEFFSRWGATTEAEFLARVDRRPEYERVRREAEAAEVAWLDARRRATDKVDVDGWLAEAATIPLARRLEEARAVTTRQRTTLAAAEDRRRSLQVRLEAAAGDRSTEQLQAELADVEDRVARQQDRRRVLERARLLLEETRAAVAREHQPPVLREASRWLSRLTDGRYPRITTAIDEARLEVHENDGTAWNPERLSRGTREQVFLALRLALVRDLGRHDVTLPVVMDDALVNFDDTRARLAAGAIVEFIAEQPFGRQMLVLTCHEHVARIFHEAGAHVRSLSDPNPLWSRPRPDQVPRALPEPVTAAVPPRAPPAPPPPPPSPPPPAPSRAPQPSREPERGEHLWPAEEFFFGGGSWSQRSTAAASLPQSALPQSTLPQSALAGPRRPPRRHAARPRRQRQ